jgi:hypothetical protein
MRTACSLRAALSPGSYAEPVRVPRVSKNGTLWSRLPGGYSSILPSLEVDAATRRPRYSSVPMQAGDVSRAARRPYCGNVSVIYSFGSPCSWFGFLFAAPCCICHVLLRDCPAA